VRIPLYQIDAFTDRPFGGNPAAVCPLERWLDDETLQGIARENNLSETAFFVEKGTGGARFHLRWFTPAAEVDLCGHATLATGYVLFNELGVEGDALRFDSRSGPLAVLRENGRLALDFPAEAPASAEVPGLAAALGRAPEAMLASPSGNAIAVYDSEAAVRALAPDFAAIAALDAKGVIATAPGESADFVSRYFAPRVGIPEDPVTGSAHCDLTPYWAERLDKTRLLAHQVSARGGVLYCRLAGDRVIIAGDAVKYLEGIIEI